LAEPAVTKIETELVKGRCKFIADDGEVGHYALKRCPGLDGWRVYTTAGVNDVTLSFRKGKGKEIEVFSNGSIGLKLEWRGIKDKHGFKPHATIVELIIKDYDLPNDKRDEYKVWGVIRMEPRNACLMVVIDAAANPDALTLARQSADSDAPGTACIKNKETLRPKIVGAETRWAKEAAGLAEPPEQPKIIPATSSAPSILSPSRARGSSRAAQSPRYTA